MLKSLLILAILTSCSVKIKNFEKYQKAPLLEVENMPTKEDLARKTPKIIILTEKQESEKSDEAKAQNTIKNSLIKELQSKQYANIVERFDSKSIQNEIKIAEIEGKSSQLISSVDYIIEVGIPNITFSRKNEEDVLYMTASAAYGHIPANRPIIYNYSSVVDGIIKLYEVPSLKIAKVITINGSHSEREKATTGSGVRIGNIAIENNTLAPSKEKDENITYKAIQNATTNAIREIKQFLKKKGFISEKRTLKNKTIFSINRGKTDDFLPQTKIAIIREVEKHNDLTNEDEKSEEIICTGTISDKSFETISWAVFEKQCQNLINLGDKVTIVY